MPELDPATRARLEARLRSTWPLVTLDRGDVLAVLAALDAAVAERDAAIERREDCNAWHQEAERERNQLRVKVGTLERKVARAVAERDKYLALWNEQGLVSRRYHEQAQDAATQNLQLRAERDQYAAVGAAARALRTNYPRLQSDAAGGVRLSYGLLRPLWVAVAALPEASD